MEQIIENKGHIINGVLILVSALMVIGLKNWIVDIQGIKLSKRQIKSFDTFLYCSSFIHILLFLLAFNSLLLKYGSLGLGLGLLFLLILCKNHLGNLYFILRRHCRSSTHIHGIELVPVLLSGRFGSKVARITFKVILFLIFALSLVLIYICP